MKRYCVCGRGLPHNWSLCKPCYEIYGRDRYSWPAWLQFLVADRRREFEYETTRDEISINDDHRPDGKVSVLNGCYNPDADDDDSEFRSLCGEPVFV